MLCIECAQASAWRDQPHMAVQHMGAAFLQPGHRQSASLGQPTLLQRWPSSSCATGSSGDVTHLPSTRYWYAYTPGCTPPASSTCSSSMSMSISASTIGQPHSMQAAAHAGTARAPEGCTGHETGGDVGHMPLESTPDTPRPSGLARFTIPYFCMQHSVEPHALCVRQG